MVKVEHSQQARADLERLQDERGELVKLIAELEAKSAKPDLSGSARSAALASAKDYSELEAARRMLPALDLQIAEAREKFREFEAQGIEAAVKDLRKLEAAHERDLLPALEGLCSIISAAYKTSVAIHAKGGESHSRIMAQLMTLPQLLTAQREMFKRIDYADQKAVN